MNIRIGTAVFSATLVDNATSAAFVKLLPLTVDMIELNGNEKYVDLSEALPVNPSNPKSIRNGDIMMYGSSTLVLFYKTFNTSYSYTRVGQVDDPSRLAAALGEENVKVTFELE